MINTILPFIHRWIPPSLTYNGREYAFQLFINHAHYDIRICYDAGDDDADPSFLFLFENIETDGDLMDALFEMTTLLKERGFLDGDYASADGYTREKYEAYMKSAD